MLLITASCCGVSDAKDPVKLRLLTYNVACGQWATPQELGKALRKENPDIVFLNEVPAVNEGRKSESWTGLLAGELGLKHIYLGTISSANHRSPEWGDVTGNYGGKFKAIISRTPLTDGVDIALQGDGWSPASSIRVVTEAGGHKIALYALHLPGTGVWEKSMHRSLAKEIMARDPTGNVIVGGDFNEQTGGVVMKELAKQCHLINAVTGPAIDHILYRMVTKRSVEDVRIEWGPKEPARKKKPMRANRRGHLSDHPWVSALLKIEAE